MKICLKSFLIVVLFGAVLSLSVLAAEEPLDVALRMANGTVIEGTMLEATPDGLVIQGEKGKYTAPWKYLSAGTRHRYELPMLIAQEVARSNALEKARVAAVKKAAAEKAAAEKAAAAKAAATNAAGTNAVGVVSNMPSANAVVTATNNPPAK